MSNRCFLWVVRATEEAKLPKTLWRRRLKRDWWFNCVLSWRPEHECKVYYGCLEMGVKAPVDEKGIVRREAAKQCITEIMEGDRGKEIKKNALKWRKLAKEVVDEGGSSDKNIEEFVAKLKHS
ncbi:hypothetical protein SLA2020_365350 [Shorea laevis]